MRGLQVEEGDEVCIIEGIGDVSFFPGCPEAKRVYAVGSDEDAEHSQCTKIRCVAQRRVSLLFYNVVYCAGIVKVVKVKQGDTVQGDDVIYELQ